MDALTQTLLKKLESDLKMRQAEFRNDHAITTAIQVTLEQIAIRLKEPDA